MDSAGQINEKIMAVQKREMEGELKETGQAWKSLEKKKLFKKEDTSDCFSTAYALNLVENVEENRNHRL